MTNNPYETRQNGMFIFYYPLMFYSREKKDANNTRNVLNLLYSYNPNAIANAFDERTL